MIASIDGTADTTVLCGFVSISERPFNSSGKRK
jgi:hypothetical protein